MQDDDADPGIWMRPETTGRGKRPSYSREQIAKAAIAIADADGIEAVSMRRVAAEIGAGTMSLYRYVRNKDELYALMADSVLEPTGPLADELAGPLPKPAPWQEVLWDLARGTRAVMLAHPWFSTVIAGVQTPGPNMLRGLEATMATIAGLGLDIDEMLEMITTVQTFAFGFAQTEIAETSALLRTGEDRDQQRDRQAPYVNKILESGDFPFVKRVIMDAKIPHMKPDEAFERAVQRIITGIAATLPEWRRGEGRGGGRGEGSVAGSG